MKTKPSLWEQTRGSEPRKLFMTVIELTNPENLGRSCQPLALLTRTRLPDVPLFLLYLQADKVSNVACSSLSCSLEIDATSLEMLTQYTMCIYKDIFNKEFVADPKLMDYWLAPVVTQWKTILHENLAHTLLEWTSIRHVAQDFANPSVQSWSKETPHEELINRFLIDRWDGGRRFFSVAIEPNLRPMDPVPGDVVLQGKEKKAESILSYSISLWSKSRARNQENWSRDQPVLRAERVLHRLNWLEEFSEKEKIARTTSYLCPEPLKFSAVGKNLFPWKTY